jgi:uncharacterized protein with HEPN domain
MPPESDVIRVRHMLNASRDALSYVDGRTRADLVTDTMLVRALVKCIEIVGEAASKVTAETRNELSAVPWTDIVGMRNRLIHTYYDVDLELVWATVEVDLPPLVAALDGWLSSR